MVKILILFISILSSTAMAADFTASVSRTEVPLNQRLILKLTLTDASTKQQPDFLEIKKLFNIVATSQLSSTKIINQESSTITEWSLTLTPKNVGNVTIPSISLNTNQGQLNSDTISIQVVNATPIPHRDKETDIFVESTISNENPYKYEPFIYTIKLYTPYDVKNVRFDPLEMEDVVVKLTGPHKIYNKHYKGKEVYVIEMSYIITSLKPGVITIPNLKICGIYTTVKGTGFTGIFDSIFDSISRDEVVVSKSKEFILQSKEFEVNILPPAAKITLGCLQNL
jgi:hypothetical protein